MKLGIFKHEAQLPVKLHPDLPLRPWWDTASLQAARVLEKHAQEIREEVMAALHRVKMEAYY